MARKLTDYLVRTKGLQATPIIVYDAGAAGGFELYWNRTYGDQVQLYGFDPNEKSSQKDNFHMYRCALDSRKQTRTFYCTKHPNSSGFYPPDPKKVDRYAWDSTMVVVGKRKVETIDLDSFMIENALPNADWMKLDTEGGEMDIFAGAQRALGTAIGLSVEVLFRPVRIDQPVFHQIDKYLDEKGFDLSRMKIFKHWRRTLTVCPMTENRGQACWAQVVYFRRMVEEIKAFPKRWDLARITKAASMLEIYGLMDMSIELVQAAQNIGVIGVDVARKYVDLLTPLVDGKVVTYQQYWNMMREDVEITDDARRTAYSYKRRWHKRLS